MQLKIARMLNRLMIGMFAVIGVLAVLVFYFAGRYPQSRLVFIIGFALAALILFAGFRWLESRWEKRVVNQMAQAGDIALAHIKSAERVTLMRDSGFKRYWIYRFEGDIYDKQHNRIPKTFYEKMAYITETVPEGWVYVTYEQSKPDHIYIIPNIMISHLPVLEPVIRKYENNKRLKVKYLDAFYKNGMVLRTYREAVKAESKEGMEPAT